MSFISIGKRNSTNCFAIRFFQTLSSVSLVFTSLSCFSEESDRINTGSGKLNHGLIDKLVNMTYCILISIFITTISLVNTDILESGTEFIDDIIPVFYTKCYSLYTLNDFYPLIILSVVFHIYGSYEYQNEPSFFYRGFNLYFIFVNCILVMFCALYTVKDDLLFIALEGTISALLFISPFLGFKYIIRPKLPEVLFLYNFKATKVIKLKIGSNINRSFLKCFLHEEKGTKLLEMYGDFHEILKQNEKKSGKLREELKKAFKLKYFDGDYEPDDNYGLKIELYKKLKDRVTDNTFDKKTYAIIKNSLINILAASNTWERFTLSEHYLNYNNFYEFCHSLRKKGIRTLSAIHEQIRVDLIVDSTENPQVFREHTKFYNDTLQSRISSVYSSSRRRSTRTASKINPMMNNNNSEIGGNNVSVVGTGNTQTANNISAVVNNMRNNRNSEFESESYTSSFNGASSNTGRRIIGGAATATTVGVAKKPSAANVKNVNRPSTTNSEYFTHETPPTTAAISMSQAGGESSSSLIKKESISDSHTDSTTDESKDEKKQEETKTDSVTPVTPVTPITPKPTTPKPITPKAFKPNSTTTQPPKADTSANTKPPVAIPPKTIPKNS